MIKKIGVLLGGKSAEREVSLRTGEAIYKALLGLGYQVVKIDVQENIAERIKEESIDMAFLALHGKYGEDGCIQGLLEILNIPYTGSGVLASALAMDKIATKRMLLQAKLPTAEFSLIRRSSYNNETKEEICQTLFKYMPLPLVVKAPTQGSTIGISFVNNEEQLPDALEEAFRYDPIALIEQFISGTEVTATVLGNNQPEALPLIEIVSNTGVYDYKAKYTVGLSDHIMPPRLKEEVQKNVQELAVKVFKTMGCSGLARVDFIVDANSNPYILEINTIPGMTETSLAPDAARAAGISFTDLTDRMIKFALEKDD
ncbi:D-alanine/D-alanine ligase [Desulfofarcimen acetoxidans DSM 771]|uniref:D-alanine--D-alanine ligase n=1 Tax=Desulfofarcimen acetoxidans (strain ATCC 49208 / DSM 771 / KCTC 5769 / VKM B-1644 / 5575) TaxID=485916 RepID=C8VZ65_DESAS|nr:D-alanine--D-alanine ligase [Desulfofarcimen acetoxidans]ACV62975.1 D-alanine/D-alanine ligase [Desulfofarcimen acetoxidans DSM 771]